MNWVLLWTDLAVLTLLFVLLLSGLWLYWQPLLRAQWARVFKRPSAVAAAMVIGAFSLVAVLDSLHWREPTGVVASALDVLLTPLHEQQETSYSAPLAIHSFVKSLKSDVSHGPERDYARLEYAGVHLSSDDDRTADLLARLALVLLISALVVVSMALLMARYARHRGPQRGQLAWRGLWAGQGNWPWRTLLISLGLLAGVISSVVLVGFDYHLMGTDKIGEDVLYQSIKSIRTGMVIGLLTTLFMLPLALSLGVSAGYFGGWVDDLIQYLYTTLNSIPGVLLIAASVLSLQVFMHNHAAWFDSMEARADARLLALCLVLGMTSWTGLARLVRAETLKLREVEFVRSARSLGVDAASILMRHILPNLGHIVLISIVLDFSVLVLAEAVLSYVGVGVDPSTYSWGNMINGARLEMAREPVVWWSLLGAFSFMFTLVLAVNVFADAVRDVFDPRVGR